jgi:dolichol kinase
MAWGYIREIARKGVHLLSLSFIVIYIVFAALFGHKVGLLALAFLLVLLIEFEYFRIEIRRKIPVISWFWWVKRPKEKERLGAEVFFLIGSIICLAIFDLRVAIAAIVMTTFGDLAAALIGKRFGKHWIKQLKKKAWEGVIAELIVDLIVGFLILRTSMWWFSGVGFGKPLWPVIIVMALTATFVETIISKLDDNLLIPVFAGFNGQIALLIISAFF